MDNNASPKLTADVTLTLAGDNIGRMICLAYSPDLNPIDDAWDSLGRRIAQKQNSPRSAQEPKIHVKQTGEFPKLTLTVQ